MPVYAGRKPKVYRVIVTVGDRNYEEAFHGTKSEALEHEARMRLALGAKGKERTQRIAPRFSDFSLEYGEHAKAHLGAATWRKVRRYQVATLAEFFGDYRLTELSTTIVDAYKGARVRAKMRATSVNNELRVLGTMLRWATEDRGLPVADAAQLKIRKLPVAGERRVHAWTLEEIARLYAAANETDPVLAPMIVFLLNTGCRKGEALAAQWAWVDESREMLSIPVTEFWKPKNKRPREIPIGDALTSTLGRLARTTRWLFPNVHGGRFAEFPNKRFAAVVHAAGLKGGPHTCRHTYASHFLRAVPDLFELARVLGHSHVRVTELYTHLLPGHLERARNAVNLPLPVPALLASDLAASNSGGTDLGQNLDK